MYTVDDVQLGHVLQSGDIDINSMIFHSIFITGIFKHFPSNDTKFLISLKLPFGPKLSDSDTYVLIHMLLCRNLRRRNLTLLITSLRCCQLFPGHSTRFSYICNTRPV